MRLLPTHQIDIPHHPLSIPRQRRRPNQTSRPIPQQIDRRHRSHRVQQRERSQHPPRRPTIPRLIEINLHPFTAQVQNIRRPRPINIRQHNPPLIENIRAIKPRRIIHRHLRPKPSIAQIRPVADLAIANPHNIRQPVPRHIRQMNRLCAIGKHHPWSLLLIPRLTHPLRRPKALLRQRRMPHKAILLRDQNVTMPIPIQVKKPHIRIIPIQIRQRLKRSERLPLLIHRPLIESWHRPPQRHHIRSPIPRQIQKLRPIRQTTHRLTRH